MVGQFVKGVAKKVSISMIKTLVYRKTRRNCNIGLSQKHLSLTTLMNTYLTVLYNSSGLCQQRYVKRLQFRS